MALLLWLTTLQTGATAWAATHASLATTPAFSNEGISPDTNTKVANIDGWGSSYSQQALGAAGFTPGTTVVSNSISFAMPAVTAGQTDNWATNGQVIAITPGGATLGFLGTAVNGNAAGNGLITYTDNSTQSFSLSLSDWTLDGGKATGPVAGSSVAAKMTYRNNGGGHQNIATYLFYTSVALTSGKTIQSVTLPVNAHLHIFAVSATSGTAPPPPPPPPPPTGTPAFNSEGVSPDTNTKVANIDGWGSSYSQQALGAAGFTPGTTVVSNNISFAMPAVTAGQTDNWATNGQVIAITPGGATLGFLGTGVDGNAAGNGMITYTDNSTQSFSLSLSDWTLDGGKATGPVAGSSVAAPMTYRNNGSGHQSIATYLFFTSVALTSGKTIQSVTLPVNAHLHIFAVSATSGTAPPPPPPPPPPTGMPAFNSEGVSPDATPGAGNTDGWGNSFSANALTTDNVVPGKTVVSNGISFAFPAVVVGQKDNWTASGQVIPITPGGATLGILGAASNGPTTGVYVVTYTDGTQQSAALTLSDWTLNGGSSGPSAGNIVVAAMPYRNNGQGRQVMGTDLFFVSVALTSGKTIQSVTLPTTVSSGQAHIFAVSATAGTATTPPPEPTVTTGGTWSTYLASNLRVGYNGAETTITASTVGSSHLKWSTSGPQGVTSQPIVVNNTLYWGSWDGNFHATNASGGALWTTNIGQLTVATCAPPTAGVAGTATYALVGSTPEIFVGGGDGKFYALNASTGAILWSTIIGYTAQGYFIWDSPAIAGGSVYIGVSSFGDCPGSQGAIYKLDAVTGGIQGILPVVPTGCGGGGVWGSPAIDEAAGLLFFASGNNNTNCPQPEPYAQAVVSVHLSNLTVAGYWGIPAAQINNTDSDFGSTPSLFTATINGTPTGMLGVPNKNGYYYAFNRANISAGPVWTDQIAIGGDCPDCGNGSISTSAFDGSQIYVAGGNVTINNVACKGSLSALNPATGVAIWQQCLTDGPVLGAVTASPGVVYIGHGATISAYNAATGASLYAYTDTTSGSAFESAITVANGQLLVGNRDGTLFAFGP